jgi:hypothetical protein
MPITKTNVFGRVSVDYAVRGVARVTWQMRRDFLNAPPFTFQLQVSYNGGGDNDTWCDVGLEIVDSNVFCCDEVPLKRAAADDAARLYGKRYALVYRVKLTTGQGTYYSGPSTILGKLSKRQWLHARAIMRKHLLEASSLVSYEGYLLKRKTNGVTCTDCVDPATGGIVNSNCEACAGTGIIDGYWLAATTSAIDISPEVNYTERDNSKTRGTINDVIVKGKFLGLPMLNSRDIWVLKDSDQRFIVRRVQNMSEINNVPIIVAAELRLAEASHAAYNIAIE